MLRLQRLKVDHKFNLTDDRIWGQGNPLAERTACSFTTQPSQPMQRQNLDTRQLRQILTGTLANWTPKLKPPFVLRCLAEVSIPWRRAFCPGHLSCTPRVQWNLWSLVGSCRLPGFLCKLLRSIVHRSRTIQSTIAYYVSSRRICTAVHGPRHQGQGQ